MVKTSFHIDVLMRGVSTVDKTSLLEIRVLTTPLTPTARELAYFNNRLHECRQTSDGAHLDEKQQTKQL